jgi:hypothetical protein
MLSPPLTQTAQALAKRRTPPMHVMVMRHHRQHLMLRMRGYPAADALSQCWDGHSSFYTQTEFQRVHGARPALQRLGEPPPDDHRTKQRGKGGARLPAPPIGPSPPPQPRRHLVSTGGLHMMQAPGQRRRSTSRTNVRSSLANVPICCGVGSWCSN